MMQSPLRVTDAVNLAPPRALRLRGHEPTLSRAGLAGRARVFRRPRTEHE